MRVNDIMQRDVPICRPTDTLSAAAQVLWTRGVTALPVVADDGEGPLLVGMLSDWDVCQAAHRLCRPLHAVRVVKAMSRDVATCSPDDSVETVLERLRARSLERLPVLDDRGCLVGMVLLADVVRHVASQRAEPDDRARSGHSAAA